jgi:hypothetical protein
MSILQRPARWLHELATNSRAFTSAPHFAFELTVKRTSDDDMAGLDLGDVTGILSGSERIHEATLRLRNWFHNYVTRRLQQEEFFAGNSPEEYVPAQVA